jgi:hypothetical protein
MNRFCGLCPAAVAISATNTTATDMLRRLIRPTSRGAASDRLRDPSLHASAGTNTTRDIVALAPGNAEAQNRGLVRPTEDRRMHP